MDGVAQFIVSFQGLSVHFCLSFAHVVTVTLGHLPAYLPVLVPVVEIIDGLALVVYPVVDDMQVRMLFIRMQYGQVLGIFDTHLFHVFPCMLRHLLHAELSPVLVAPT